MNNKMSCLALVLAMIAAAAAAVTATGTVNAAKSITKSCLLPPELQGGRRFCETPYVPERICHAPGNNCATPAPASLNNNNNNNNNTSAVPTTATTHVCSVVAHALLTDYEIFDVVLLHDMSCQDEILAGDLDRVHVYERVLPYNEPLVALQLNGSDLVAAIEHGLDQYHFQNIPEAYPRVAGIKYKVNLDFPYGNRMRKIQVLNFECKWKKLKPHFTYQVLTTESLAYGAFDYVALTRAAMRAPLKGFHLADAFWAYSQSMCVLHDPFRPIRHEMTTAKQVEASDVLKREAVRGVQQKAAATKPLRR